MELGETDADAAFGAYPFDPSAVGVNVNNRWPVSKRLMMAHQDSGNRALPPSPPPLIIGGGIGPSASANWPPSRRREEARALSNLEKKVGSCRVRQTSSFKMIPIVDEKDREERNRDKESSVSLNSNKTEAPKGLDNRPQMLRKIYSNRPLSIINDTNETDTEWYTSEFITECLCWHNVYRQRHGAPPLSMCPDLCSYAQEWANTLAHLNTFYYRPNSRDIGQNVYCRLNVKEPSDVSGQEVASNWYSACRQYDYLKEPDVLHANVNADQLMYRKAIKDGIALCYCDKQLLSLPNMSMYEPNRCFIACAIGKLLFHLSKHEILLEMLAAQVTSRSADVTGERIFNGTPIDITKAPYQVQIHYPGNALTTYYCGGSIITPIHVLTAAHCISERLGTILIRTGTSKLDDKGDAIKVKKFFRHPLYNPTTVDYDLAILELVRPIEFHNASKPISLATKGPSVGETIQISGWGKPEHSSPNSAILLTTNKTVIGFQECQKLYIPAQLKSHKFCAHGGGGSTCNGDSGSPSILKGVQVGIIVEGGYLCEGPDVEMNVAHPNIRNFIRKITGVE